MNTVLVGDIGESVAIAAFTTAGLVVSKPLSNNAKYDLIVELNNSLYKVQVKSTNSIKNDKMYFATKTTNYSKGSWSSNTYTKDDVDIFFLYCLENDWAGLYFLEDNTVAPINITLHLAAPKNGQKAHIRLAEDYTFAKQLQNYMS